MVMAGSQALLSMPAAAANGIDPQALAAAAAQSGDAASLHGGRPFFNQLLFKYFFSLFFQV